MEWGKTICLISSGSRDVFPGNGPVHFANTFPNPLVDRADRRFVIRLRYIAINQELIARYSDKTRFVVEISEIEPQFDGRHLTSRLGAFPLGKAVENVRRSRTPWNVIRRLYHEHSFRQAPALPLKFQTLKQLHVRITDDEGRDLSYHIPNAVPTIIMIDLEEEDFDRGQFTVMCRSHGEGLHTNNELHDFVSPLPSKLELKDYEVAVQSVVYPPYLREETKPITLKVTVRKRTILFDYTYSVNLYNTPAFLARVMSDLERNPALNHQLHMEKDPDGDGSSYRLRRVQRTVSAVTPTLMHIQASPAFLEVMCGEREARFVNPSTYLLPGDTLTLPGMPDISRLAPISVAMLECNMVTPNVIGGQRANMLMCVPILYERDGDQNRLYEPQELIFQPVEEIPFASLHLKFTRPDREPCRFIVLPEGGHRIKNIFVTLLFRKRMRGLQ